MRAYLEALSQCGFKPGLTYTRKPYAWKVSCNPSSCFQVSLCLSEDLEVLKVEERPLSWVHGSLLSGGEVVFKDEVREL